MILKNIEWFLLGAFSILFLYFATYFVTKRSERYNMYLAIGCFLSIVRIISFSLIYSMDSTWRFYEINVKIDHLQFILGPLFYMLLANSFFDGIMKKWVFRMFLALDVIISLFIIFVPMENVPYYLSYDYLIVASMIYSSYIFIIALIKKRDYSILLFVMNLAFMIAIVHDVLVGSSIIKTPFGELYAYAYLLYLYVAAVISAKKYQAMDKKRLESQLNFLHAQIQPHFLYNTINTIVAYCRTDPEQSRQLLIELSVYLRGKFKSEKDMFTPLKDEIALIKSYLTIEKVRFKDRIEVEYDIDEECDILIPCLILQPIVENAIKHGLIPKKNGGKLLVSVKNEKSTVVVTVKDDGVGIERQNLEEILAGRNEGIGLSNTNERLKKYYNTEIIAVSEPGKGTEFTVKIPMGGGKIV